MIQQLLLDSPIKSLVEEVHSYQFFHQNHVPGGRVREAAQPTMPASIKTSAGHTKSNSHFIDPLKKALEGQQMTGGTYAINERTDVAVLNILLNQILTGKYTYDKERVFA